MSLAAGMELAHAVLDHYPGPIRHAPLHFLGNHGGFSGAWIWRGEAVPPFCLRAWPPGTNLPYLRYVHGLMIQARAAALPFVPAIHKSTNGDSIVAHAGRLWEVTEWLPGVADFHANPSAVRLQAACTTLARIHLAWADKAEAAAPCPAVLRRLRACEDWASLLRSGWQLPANLPADNPISRWATRAWDCLTRHIDRVPALLASWLARPVPLQPCLCDIWHDHVLFQADKVTGIIDYGSLKVDSVAADLARLLGSLAGDRTSLRTAGLTAYSHVRLLSFAEEELIGVLDRTGTILGAANWLRWIYHECRNCDDRQGVARRLAALVERMERWD